MRFIFPAAILLVAACGGSTTGPLTLADLKERDLLFQERANSGQGGFAPTVTLPDYATASYSGVAFVVIGTDQPQGDSVAALGAAELTVDLVNARVSGTADTFFQIDQFSSLNIQQAEGDPITGTLTYALTQTAAGENSFNGRVVGTITALDGQAYDFNLDGGGVLGGENAEVFGIEAAQGNIAAAILTSRD
ncbi:hypothetical protein [Yoonia sp. 208BN28-4]|uniref:hypothetical protein n=1 Tax=Yoonia sp. 208BN28-4 TaxID=3126505 RepID=UPI0030A87357